MSNFTFTNGVWEYTGELSEITNEIGDSLIINNTNPSLFSRASAEFARYIVASSQVAWQKSWRKIKVEKVKDKLLVIGDNSEGNIG